jgi:hypothetical protein
LRIKCAVEDISVQKFVAALLAEAAKDVRIPILNRGEGPS